MAKGDKLTPKQAMFVKEYLIDLNATQAAIRAGYSEKTAGQMGDENLKKPEIADAIQKEMDKRFERVEITADYILGTIRDTVERCRQAHPVLDRKGSHVLVSTPEGDLKPAYTFEPHAVIKGCELLGKHKKLWNDVGSKENPLTVEENELTAFERANRLAHLIAVAQGRLLNGDEKPA